jgi:hypothetical protein
MSIHFKDPDIRISELAGKFKTYLLSYSTGMLPHPEKVYEGQLPGPLELSFAGNSLRFGLWPERELQQRLKQVRSAASHAAPN